MKIVCMTYCHETPNCDKNAAALIYVSQRVDYSKTPGQSVQVAKNYKKETLQRFAQMFMEPVCIPHICHFFDTGTISN